MSITFGVAPSLLALYMGFPFSPRSPSTLQLRPDLHHAGALYLFPLSYRRAPRGWRGSTSATTLSPGIRVAGAQVFCRDADPAAAGTSGRHRSISARVSPGASLVGRHDLAAFGRALSGFLMVSTWRFWSGKEISFSRRHPFQILFLLSIVLFVILQIFPSCALRHAPFCTCFQESGRGRPIRGRAADAAKAGRHWISSRPHAKPTP